VRLDPHFGFIRRKLELSPGGRQTLPRFAVFGLGFCLFSMLGLTTSSEKELSQSPHACFPFTCVFCFSCGLRLFFCWHDLLYSSSELELSSIFSVCLCLPRILVVT